jgi:hypothetical protein
LPESQIRLSIESSTKKITETNPKTGMEIKKVALSLGLQENADETAISAKILELKQHSGYKEKYDALSASIELQKKTDFANKVQLAIDVKALDASLKEDYIKLYGQSPEMAENMIAKLKAPKDLSSFVGGQGGSTPITLSAEYDEAEKNGTLHEVLANQPEKFKLMYKAKYGTEPEV